MFIDNVPSFAISTDLNQTHHVTKFILPNSSLLFFCQMSKQFILIPMLISGKNRSTRSTDRFLFRSSLLIVTTYSSAPTHSITITAKHTLPTFILTLWFLLTYYMHQMRVGASELCTSKTAAKENSCCPDDTYLSKCWLQQHPLF